jgi:hypothetical protein
MLENFPEARKHSGEFLGHRADRLKNEMARRVLNLET